MNVIVIVIFSYLNVAGQVGGNIPDEMASGLPRLTEAKTYLAS